MPGRRLCQKPHPMAAFARRSPALGMAGAIRRTLPHLLTVAIRLRTPAGFDSLVQQNPIDDFPQGHPSLLSGDLANVPSPIPIPKPPVLGCLRSGVIVTRPEEWKALSFFWNRDIGDNLADAALDCGPESAEHYRHRLLPYKFVETLWALSEESREDSHERTI